MLRKCILVFLLVMSLSFSINNISIKIVGNISLEKIMEYGKEGIDYIEKDDGIIIRSLTGNPLVLYIKNNCILFQTIPEEIHGSCQYKIYSNISEIDFYKCGESYGINLEIYENEIMGEYFLIKNDTAYCDVIFKKEFEKFLENCSIKYQLLNCSNNTLYFPDFPEEDFERMVKQEISKINGTFGYIKEYKFERCTNYTILDIPEGTIKLVNKKSFSVSFPSKNENKNYNTDIVEIRKRYLLFRKVMVLIPILLAIPPIIIWWKKWKGK